MAQPESPLTSLLPAEIGGWVPSANDRAYTPDNLYDYINGGAELYLSFGLAGVLSRRYSRAGQPDIVVDLFDMKTSQNAFGVFSLSSETPDTAYGQGSQYTRGLLLFWKDKYFVSVLATPETEDARSAIGSLARSIEDAISAEGAAPAILSLLPAQSLSRETIRYFRHHIWQNAHYFISTENILHIDESTDAVLAKYGEPGSRYVLLLVKYENPEDARAGRAGFVEHYLPEASESPVARVEDGTWAGCRLVGAVLAVVLNAPTERAALDLIGAVEAGSPP